MSACDDHAPLARTPLYALHQELGARMVPFAGYTMPLQFRTGIVREHLHTREEAGLFDVSHMGQFRLTGDLSALERLCPIDMDSLQPGQQRYTVLTDDCGGIVDDLMVSRIDDYLMLVVNAARKKDDAAHLRQHLGADCSVEALAERALLALQGPAAATVLARLAPQATQLVFMTGGWFRVADAACYVTRAGYTGEDGFEISVPGSAAESLARALLAQPEVAPIGLGARDSLRLEAGMCLYGHDIDAGTSPVEANLGWAIARTRRDGPRRGGFPGADIILAQLREGVTRQRTGILPEGRVPVRDGAELRAATGEVVGRVTSGGFSPTLNRPIAMAYVQSGSAQPGTFVTAQVRDKALPARVVHLPFVAPRYHRG